MGCSTSSLTKESVITKANKMKLNKIGSDPFKKKKPALKQKIIFLSKESDLTRKAKDTKKRGTRQLKNEFNFQIDDSASEFEIEPKECPESELSCLSSGSWSQSVEHFDFSEEPSVQFRADEN